MKIIRAANNDAPIMPSDQIIPERVNQLAQDIDADVISKPDHFKLDFKGEYMTTDILQKLVDYKDLNPHIMILNNKLVVFVWAK